jgi:hypothetical protein
VEEGREGGREEGREGRRGREGKGGRERGGKDVRATHRQVHHTKNLARTGRQQQRFPPQSAHDTL